MRALQAGIARMPRRAAAIRALVTLVMLAAALPAALPAVAPATAQDGGFVSEIPDLPLMPGLVELADAGVVFDKPSGRIVEAYAQGPVAPGEIFAFYRQSLPQLGWQPVGERGFAREGERLTIEVIDPEAPLTLRFSLRPE